MNIFLLKYFFDGKQKLFHPILEKKGLLSYFNFFYSDQYVTAHVHTRTKPENTYKSFVLEEKTPNIAKVNPQRLLFKLFMHNNIWASLPIVVKTRIYKWENYNIDPMIVKDCTFGKISTFLINQITPRMGLSKKSKTVVHWRTKDSITRNLLLISAYSVDLCETWSTSLMVLKSANIFLSFYFVQRCLIFKLTVKLIIFNLQQNTYSCRNWEWFWEHLKPQNKFSKEKILCPNSFLFS